MIFDTDVLIWALRGSDEAIRIIEADSDRAVSVVSYLELFQGARDKKDLAGVRRFLLDFETLPLSEDIGNRAAIYMAEYTLKAGLQLADALIAATAVENQRTLCSGNTRHFQAISDLMLKRFRP